MDNIKIFVKCKKLGIIKNCIEINLQKQKRTSRKIIFFELQSLYDLVYFLELCLSMPLDLNILFDEVEGELKHEWLVNLNTRKHFVRSICIIFYLKNCYEWLKLYTCREQIP